MSNQQWDTLYLNANLATIPSDDDLGIINNAALAIKDGKIAWLGARQALPAAPTTLANECVDCAQQWITPGLIDCHTHLVYAGNRSREFAMRLAGQSYAEIAKAGGGILSTVQATRQASLEALYQQSAQRLQTCLQCGVTTIEIKSGYGLDLDTEMKMLRVAQMLEQNFPVRIQKTLLAAHTLPPEFSQVEAYIEHICQQILPQLYAQGLVDAVDAFCEKIAFSTQQLEPLFARAKQLGLPVKLHAEQLSNQHGAQMAARYQALSVDHLEYIDAAGVQAIAAAGTVAVLLPGAFYYLQETQKPPVELLRQYKVPIAIATDCNPGSSPITALPWVMNMACILFGLTIEQAWAAVTLHAAKALGLEQCIGSLSVGKLAEFAFWEISHPAEVIYQLGTFAKPANADLTKVKFD
jgi:imidazolonepropionase